MERLVLQMFTMRITRLRGVALTYACATLAIAGLACTSAPAATTASAPARTPAASTASTASTTPSVATRDRIAAIRDEVLNRTNGERRAAGLPSLTRSVNLMSAAQLQAEQMAAASEMSHDLPGAAYPTLRDRVASVSYAWRAIAENVAEGQGGAAAVVASWMSSSGHRANILGASYTEIGAGLAYSRSGRPFWAQVFGRPR